MVGIFNKFGYKNIELPNKYLHQLIYKGYLLKGGIELNNMKMLSISLIANVVDVASHRLDDPREMTRLPLRLHLYDWWARPSPSTSNAHLPASACLGGGIGARPRAHGCRPCASPAPAASSRRGSSTSSSTAGTTRFDLSGGIFSGCASSRRHRCPARRRRVRRRSRGRCTG